MLLQGSRNGEVIGMVSIQSPQVLMCDDLVVGSVLSYPVFILQNKNSPGFYTYRVVLLAPSFAYTRKVDVREFQVKN